MQRKWGGGGSGRRAEVLNACKVVNRKFDTGISYRIEALGAEKKEKKEEGQRKKNS